MQIHSNGLRFNVKRTTENKSKTKTTRATKWWIEIYIYISCNFCLCRIVSLCVRCDANNYSGDTLSELPWNVCFQWTWNYGINIFGIECRLTSSSTHRHLIFLSLYGKHLHPTANRYVTTHCELQCEPLLPFRFILKVKWIASQYCRLFLKIKIVSAVLQFVQFHSILQRAMYSNIDQIMFRLNVEKYIFLIFISF